MSFIVGALPYSGWEQVMPLLSRMGWHGGDPGEVEHWQRQDDGITPVLVLHRRPERILAAAMEAGMAPAAAVEFWQQRATTLLDWLKRNRRRASLIETDALLVGDSDLGALGERLNISVPAVTEQMALPVARPLQLLLAAQMVQQSADCQSLLAALEANTLPLNECSFTAPGLDVDAVADTVSAAAEAARENELNSQKLLVQAQRDMLRLEQQLDAQRHDSISRGHEAALLMEQLHLVQEELEVQLEQKKQLEVELGRHKVDLAAVQSELGSLRASYRQLSEQAGSERHELQARLETEARQNLELKQRQTVLEQQLQRALEAQKAVTASEAKMLQQQLHGQEEAKLLLEQLHLVQEELEAQLEQKKQLEDGLHGYRTQLADVQSELKSLQQSYKKVSDQAAHRQQQLNASQSRSVEVEAQCKELQARLDTETRLSHQLHQQLESIRKRLQQAAEDEKAAQASAVEVQQRQQQSEEEVRLLLEQLHLVQEELESRFYQRQQLEREIVESDAALAVANGEIAKLQVELNGIKASRFYRLVKPAPEKPNDGGGSSKRRVQRNVRKLKASALFDAEWYLMTYADVAESQMDPARHYIKFGAAEGRDPGPHFNTNWYLQVNRDVAESGINPLIHYIEHGSAEGRSPNPAQQSHLPAPGVTD